MPPAEEDPDALHAGGPASPNYEYLAAFPTRVAADGDDSNLDASESSDGGEFREREL